MFPAEEQGQHNRRQQQNSEDHHEEIKAHQFHPAYLNGSIGARVDCRQFAAPCIRLPLGTRLIEGNQYPEYGISPDGQVGP
jgi:hypothetical protein